MESKIGRNDPCWCGSGKKYKKCHLDRHNQEQLPKDQINNRLSKIFSVKKCYAKNIFSGECSKKIIKAHTVSKSGSLKKISSISGNVMGLNKKFSFSRNYSSFNDLKEIGLNKASTFSGFCSNHDKNIFSPIEDKLLAPDPEQCLLLAYRGLIYELYAKEYAINHNDFLREFDKGKDILTQIQMQKELDIHKDASLVSISDINYIKERIEKSLLNKNYSNFSHLVINLLNTPNILTSSSLLPDIDFNGNLVQDITDVNSHMATLMINCVCSDEKGFFIFSWHKDDNDICHKFCDTLISLGNKEIGNALLRFCFSHIENIFSSPQWWKNLSDQKKGKIKKMIGMGFMESKDPKCLVPDGIDYNAMNVEGYSFLE